MKLYDFVSEKIVDFSFKRKRLAGLTQDSKAVVEC
jgi:hypothetical protein